MYYPRSKKPSATALAVVAAFDGVSTEIDSSCRDIESNEVLRLLAPALMAAGFRVETGKTADTKISVPVLFGANGKIEKSFDADAYQESSGFVVEVEAPRGVVNNQFLKDLFQACMMFNVRELAIAVRKVYKGRNDFDGVTRFFDTLYASDRLTLPLEGILILGY